MNSSLFQVLIQTRRDRNSSLEDFFLNFPPPEDKEKKTPWFKVIQELQRGKELKTLDVTALYAVSVHSNFMKNILFNLFISSSEAKK